MRVHCLLSLENQLNVSIDRAVVAHTRLFVKIWDKTGTLQECDTCK